MTYKKFSLHSSEKCIQSTKTMHNVQAHHALCDGCVNAWGVCWEGCSQVRMAMPPGSGQGCTHTGVAESHRQRCSHVGLWGIDSKGQAAQLGMEHVKQCGSFSLPTNLPSLRICPGTYSCIRKTFLSVLKAFFLPIKCKYQGWGAYLDLSVTSSARISGQLADS